MYTSPHLLSVCERIRINSQPISKGLFTKYFSEMWDRLRIGAEKRGGDPRLKLSYARFLTLMSFHVFLEESVDVAIYEVGVGGQFDSTNIISRPTATGITSLGIDHVQSLGNTIEEIAWHKAGIMKTGLPAYTVWQPEEAMHVLTRRAEERQVVLSEVPIATCLGGVRIQPEEDFQKRNASLAIVLATQASARLDTSEMDARDLPSVLLHGKDQDSAEVLNVDLPELFKIGLTSTIWRGRGEILSKTYGTWLLDGAHTKDSLEIVSDWYGRTIRQARSSGEDPLCVLVFNQQSKNRNSRDLL
jgi:folylpolyglutamate synthase